jgi:uncharacterized Zn-binding protein involved in type VI secretion
LAEIIVIGDKTSHGGVVIQGTPASDIAGKLIARVGDKVTCPIPGHGGVTVIASGDPTLTIDGAAVARHGDKTACGAVLLCSQVTTTDRPGGSGARASGGAGASSLTSDAGAGGGSSGSGLGLSANAPGPTSSNTTSPAEALAAADAATKYDMHFLLKDKTTGAPLADMPYRITLASGQEVTGNTDKTGHTQKVKSDSAEVAKLEAPYYGDSTSSSDTHDGHDACGC